MQHKSHVDVCGEFSILEVCVISSQDKIHFRTEKNQLSQNAFWLYKLCVLESVADRLHQKEIIIKRQKKLNKMKISQKIKNNIYQR
jgi:hypothetical protein